MQFHEGQIVQIKETYNCAYSKEIRGALGIVESFNDSYIYVILKKESIKNQEKIPYGWINGQVLSFDRINVQPYLTITKTKIIGKQ